MIGVRLYRRCTFRGTLAGSGSRSQDGLGSFRTGAAPAKILHGWTIYADLDDLLSDPEVASLQVALAQHTTIMSRQKA